MEVRCKPTKHPFREEARVIRRLERSIRCRSFSLRNFCGINYCDTGSNVGLAATPFCVTSTSSSPELALLGTWKLI